MVQAQGKGVARYKRLLVPPREPLSSFAPYLAIKDLLAMRRSSRVHVMPHSRISGWNRSISRPCGKWWPKPGF